MSREPGSGGSTLLLLGSLGLVAAFVFGVLPRYMSPPVVTTVAPPTATAATAPALPSNVPTPAARDGVLAPRAEAARPAAAQPDDRLERAPLPPSEGPHDWKAAVSAGLAALDRSEFAEAREAFSRAETLRAGSPVVADGLARAQAGLLEHSLVTHRKAAEAAEAREDWRGALVEYDAALKLEPAVSFAVLGRTRSVLRLATDERLQGYLERPDRLSAEAVAREATAALEQTEELQPAGPRLAAQRSALEKLLAGVRQPVAVRLVSDGLTAVTILRVGALGTFKEKALELRPGSYVVVGARAGYRDARHTFVVPVGQSPAPLDIRCREAL